MNQTKTYADQEVIERVIKGEKALFEIIVRRFNAALYKVGRGYGFELEDTKDLMQETFISAYQHLEKFEHRSSFKTWLIRIMLNNCYRRKQKQKSGVKWAYGIEIGSNSNTLIEDIHNNTDRFMQRKELGQIIEQAMLKIPYDYRMVFTLREISDLSGEETARLLDISEANVKVRLNRAKAMLRRAISNEYTPKELYDFNLVHCDEIVRGVMSHIFAIKASK